MSAAAPGEAGKAKRKRTRVRKRRGGRRGGGGGGAGGLNLSSSDSDDDGSSSDSAGDSAKAAGKKLDKGKARAAEPVAVANAKEDSGDDSDSSEASSSSSSSSSSSFLSSSSDESTAPIIQQNLPNGHHLTNGHAAPPGAADVDSRSKRTRPPSPVREPSPPYLLFGNAADNNPEAYRALGKPILHPHLPEDNALSAEDSAQRAAQIAAEEEQAKAEYMQFREFYVSRMVSRYGNQLDEIRKKEGDTLSERRLGMLIAAVGNGADSFLSEKGKGIWKAPKGRGERETVLEALKRGQQQDDDAEEGDVEMD